MRYANLEAEFTRMGLSVEEVGEKLGFAKVVLYNRLNGKTSWTLSDMLKVQKLVNDRLGKQYTLDYLFSKG